MPDYLTRVDALVAAAVLTVHPGRQPTWAGIAARLTAWAHEQPQTEHEEGEMPSQTGFPERRPARMGTENEAVPEVRKHRGDLTASTSTERTGGRGL